MKYDIEELSEQISQHPYFLKLKTVVENNGYHDHEDVYSHLQKTFKIAQDKIKGQFITNQEAKDAFETFINIDVNGMKKKDVMLLTSLLHDIGKILMFKEDTETKPLIVINENKTTICPGHEYWGSTIVLHLVKNLNLPEEVVKQIETAVRLHDTFNQDYFDSKKSLTDEELLNNIKSCAEEMYKEVLFNVYCSRTSAIPFQETLAKIEKLFNHPGLYLSRSYFIP